MSGLEYEGDIKFESCGVKPQMSREDWISRASEQGRFASVSACILNIPDQELERFAR